MTDTAFPATPADVAILTVQEFMFNLDELDTKRVPSLGRVCGAFMGDANRALVWWIRFGALQGWCARANGGPSSSRDAWIVRDACEVAASLPLDHLWAFDERDFASALENLAKKRTRAAAIVAATSQTPAS
jgi:hypothetical protein